MICTETQSGASVKASCLAWPQVGLTQLKVVVTRQAAAAVICIAGAPLRSACMGVYCSDLEDVKQAMHKMPALAQA